MRSTQFCEDFFSAALAIHTFGDAGGHVNKMFRHVFIDNNCSMVSIVAGSYIQLVVLHEDVSTTFSSVAICGNVLKRPSVFQTLFVFHSLRMMVRFCKYKSFSSDVSYKIGMRAALAAQSFFLHGKP